MARRKYLSVLSPREAGRTVAARLLTLLKFVDWTGHGDR
jgi:hypothetical protein